MREAVIITGASAGIGKALATEFASHGHSLVLVARNENKLNEIKTKLEKEFEIEVAICVADLLQEDAPKQILTYIQENGIDVQCLINNAGMGDACRFEMSEWEKDESIVRLNIISLMQLNRLFIPIMRQRGGGTIANIASTLAFAPTAGEAVYAASKAFVLSFGQALYEETKGTGVSVLTICPGVTNTDFFKSAGFELGQFKAATPESFAEFAYKSIIRKHALSVHRFSNRMTALFCRLAPRKVVREIFASACKVE